MKTPTLLPTISPFTLSETLVDDLRFGPCRIRNKVYLEWCFETHHNNTGILSAVSSSDPLNLL